MRKRKQKQNKMCNQSSFDLITCTLIIMYYDDGMTECTEDDWQLSPECFFFLFFFSFSKLLLKSGRRMLKKSIIILIIMIIQVVLLPP